MRATIAVHYSLLVGQKAMRGLLVDSRLKKNVPFLNSAIDHANSRCIAVRRDRRYLRRLTGCSGTGILWKCDVFWLDDFEDVRITDNEIAQTFARNPYSDSEAVGECNCVEGLPIYKMDEFRCIMSCELFDLCFTFAL